MNTNTYGGEAQNALLVGELMTPDPIVIDESAGVDEAVRLLEENEISGLPVVDREGVLLGVLSQTDIVRARAVGYLWHRWPGLRVRHLMHSPALTADRSMSLEEAAQRYLTMYGTGGDSPIVPFHEKPPAWPTSEK